MSKMVAKACGELVRQEEALSGGVDARTLQGVATNQRGEKNDQRQPAADDPTGTGRGCTTPTSSIPSSRLHRRSPRHVRTTPRIVPQTVSIHSRRETYTAGKRCVLIEGRPTGKKWWYRTRLPVVADVQGLVADSLFADLTCRSTGDRPPCGSG